MAASRVENRATPLTMGPNVAPVAAAAKATARRTRQADPLQRGRQGALRGYAEVVAARRGISYHTLMHELDDGSRDPVHKAAATVRALREAGAAPERIHLYLVELTRELRLVAAVSRGSVDALRALISAESHSDADENVVQDRALLNGLTPADRRAWADQIVRNMANESALLDALLDMPEADA